MTPFLTGLLAVSPSPPPNDQTTTYVIMGGACLFIVYTMMRLTKRKSKKDPFDTPFQTRSLAQQRSTERQFETLLVEFSEMSRQMSAQLDTRSAKLEALIQDADQRLAELKALIEQSPARPNFAMPPEPQRPPAEPAEVPAPIAIARADDVSPSPTVEPGHAEVYRLADDGKSVQNHRRRAESSQRRSGTDPRAQAALVSAATVIEALSMSAVRSYSLSRCGRERVRVRASDERDRQSHSGWTFDPFCRRPPVGDLVFSVAKPSP